jgi:outer membrane protein OmpA-like peptidoglycan-associated protein
MRTSQHAYAQKQKRAAGKAMAHRAAVYAYATRLLSAATVGSSVPAVLCTCWGTDPNKSRHRCGEPGIGRAHEGIFFDFDAAAIRNDQMPALQQDFAYLKAHQQVKVTVEGYCDERGTEEYNLALKASARTVSRPSATGRTSRSRPDMTRTRGA